MISIVIPALNEARALPATLRSVVGQGGDYEIILVDGGSTDATLQRARETAGLQVIRTGPGRAVQMNAGARVAHGELLLFLHADTQLPPGAIRHLNELEADPEFTSGGFRHQFSGPQLPLRFVSWLHNLRCRLTHVFYGDQAMVVRRSVFEELDGFPEEPVLEDILLSEKLREHAQPRILDMTVLTDSRKFEQMGPWRSLLRCLLILGCYELRLPIRGRAFFAAIR
ncbi:MAG: TIGR04283 family arsenosugar biosynthesis glycosyltransferase [Gammaproteobacteria bacterium]|nr:TIGR04283 family arsenosugar biosynthesis glycosyltransferase [Gammaproteobacteria bacterium]